MEIRKNLKEKENLKGKVLRDYEKFEEDLKDGKYTIVKYLGFTVLIHKDWRNEVSECLKIFKYLNEKILNGGLSEALNEKEYMVLFDKRTFFKTYGTHLDKDSSDKYFFKNTIIIRKKGFTGHYCQTFVHELSHFIDYYLSNDEKNRYSNKNNFSYILKKGDNLFVKFVKNIKELLHSEYKEKADKEAFAETFAHYVMVKMKNEKYKNFNYLKKDNKNLNEAYKKINESINLIKIKA
ncbi:hypothetical protein BFS06_14495 [Clostridium perfringens]|uniref:Putative endopeptidase n=1 Tax=Clostridium perfringens TaxID=1502 RepID=A0A140GRB0_CLOPF|nr:hypothetical protein [Clostridium perfringens]AMN31069.1 putative endopeptidase [Clostridium perfringens]TBX14414.1 hypothetical protein BFS06_14495 [Clostridium perfringens]